MKHEDTLEEKTKDQLKTPDDRYEGETQFFVGTFINSPIGIYIVKDGKFQFVNPEFQKITGYEEPELLGIESLGIVYPDDKGMVRENAIRMLKGDLATPYIYRTMNKNGGTRWIIETVTSITYGGERAVLGYFMDNTEREEAKEALRLSEEKFHKAFRSSPDWFVITTLDDGVYIEVNEAFLRSTGYHRQEVIGHTSNELGIWVDPYQRTRMSNILREEGVVRNLEVEFRMKSGTVRNVLWSAEVIDFHGTKCLIAVNRDITDRRRAELEQLKREKLQGVLELAGAACHELNQPLQYIYLLLNDVLHEYPDNEKVIEIKNQFDRIRDITHKLDSITTYETKDYIRGAKIVDIDKASKQEHLFKQT